MFRLVLAILAALMIATPTLAHNGDFTDLRRAGNWSECGDCLPPQVDAVIMRPVALFGAGPVSLAAFAIGAPFVALADAKALGPFFMSTVGGVGKYVFVDPLGTH